MRFTGNIDAKTDTKGRVFLPAAFRKILLASGEASLVLRKDVFQKCLILYPESIWNQQVDMIAARTSAFDRKGREVLRRFVAGAEYITPDSNGRILLTKRNLQAAEIKNDIRFIGVDNTIEIWARETVEQWEAEDFGDELELLMRPEQEKTQNDND